MGYSPWGHKESDTTERLSTHSLINRRSIRNSIIRHWTTGRERSVIPEKKETKKVNPTLTEAFCMGLIYELQHTEGTQGWQLC